MNRPRRRLFQRNRRYEDCLLERVDDLFNYISSVEEKVDGLYKIIKSMEGNNVKKNKKKI